MYKQHHKKILFTELGYKSMKNSAAKPWEWVEYDKSYDGRLSYETQANCYEAFFKTIWSQDWFGGVHIWQMRSDFGKSDGNSDFDFTPQGKPAEMVIRKGFKSEI